MTVAGRSGLDKTREAIASWGLGAWLLVALVGGGAVRRLRQRGHLVAQESRLQVAISATGLVCGVGLASGALRAGREASAWTGVALLVGFGLWSALSVLWSAAPDESWLAANRAVAYAIVAAVAIVAAANTRAAPRGRRLRDRRRRHRRRPLRARRQDRARAALRVHRPQPRQRVLPRPRADRLLERGRDPLRDGGPGLHLAGRLPGGTGAAAGRLDARPDRPASDHRHHLLARGPDRLCRGRRGDGRRRPPAPAAAWRSESGR